MRDWQNFFEVEEYYGFFDNGHSVEAAVKRINAKIREALEAAPKVYGREEDVADGRVAWLMSEIRSNTDTHTARLVDVKPIEKGDSSD